MINDNIFFHLNQLLVVNSCCVFTFSMHYSFQSLCCFCSAGWVLGYSSNVNDRPSLLLSLVSTLIKAIFLYVLHQLVVIVIGKMICFNRRRLTYITTGSYFFLVGVEYAVIIPTLNLYLGSLDASYFYMGFCLSAMSLTSLLSAPIYGRITDVLRTTKVIVIISNIFAISGNFLYGIAKTPYMIIVSRLIVGVAAGSTSSMLSMISRSTTQEERTGTLSKIFTGRQTGMIIGPAFNLGLKYININIGSINVGPYNSPGFLMALCWILETVFIVFFYHDLEAPETDQISISESNLPSDVAESLTSNSQSNQQDSIPQKSLFLSYVYSDLFSEESVLFLFSTFVIMFVQVGMEALLTPLSKIYFDWGEVENSIYYSVLGALYVVSLVSLTFASRKFRDRHLILFGLISLTLNSVLFVILVAIGGQQHSSDNSTYVMYFLFTLYGAVVGLTMAYAWVPLMSLFTKFTSVENQGFTQGVRLVFTGLGKILGPLWSGTLPHNLILMTSVNLGLYLLILIMLLASYKKIVFREKKLEEASSESDGSEEFVTEKSPLLSIQRKNQRA